VPAECLGIRGRAKPKTPPHRARLGDPESARKSQVLARFVFGLVYPRPGRPLLPPGPAPCNLLRSMHPATIFIFIFGGVAWLCHARRTNKARTKSYPKTLGLDTRHSPNKQNDAKPHTIAGSSRVSQVTYVQTWYNLYYIQFSIDYCAALICAICTRVRTYVRTFARTSSFPLLQCGQWQGFRSRGVSSSSTGRRPAVDDAAVGKLGIDPPNHLQV